MRLINLLYLFKYTAWYAAWDSLSLIAQPNLLVVNRTVTTDALEYTRKYCQCQHEDSLSSETVIYIYIMIF